VSDIVSAFRSSIDYQKIWVNLR